MVHAELKSVKPVMDKPSETALHISCLFKSKQMKKLNLFILSFCLILFVSCDNTTGVRGRPDCIWCKGKGYVESDPFLGFRNRWDCESCKNTPSSIIVVSEPDPEPDPNPDPNEPTPHYNPCMGCSSTGLCIICEGEGSNYDVSCQNCYGTGKCPLCHGEGQVFVGFD